MVGNSIKACFYVFILILFEELDSWLQSCYDSGSPVLPAEIVRSLDRSVIMICVFIAITRPLRKRPLRKKYRLYLPR